MDSYPHSELFGTKKNGRWQWTTYREFGRDVEKFRGGLASLGVTRGTTSPSSRTTASSGPWAPTRPTASAWRSSRCTRRSSRRTGSSSCATARRRRSSSRTGHPRQDAPLPEVDPVAEAHRRHRRRVERERRRGITTYKALLEPGKTRPAVTAGRDDIAGLIYTSGTTGNPKGVILSHYNIASNIGRFSRSSRSRGPTARCRSSLGALVRADRASCTASSRTGASTAFAEAVDKIIDNLAEVQPDAALQRPAHLQQDLRGGAEAHREQAQGDPGRGRAGAAHREQAARGEDNHRRGARGVRGGRQGRLLEGAAEVRRPAASTP